MGESKLISFFLFAGFRLALQLALVVAVVLVARRFKMKGLWVLAGAAALAAVEAIVEVLVSSPFRLVQLETVMQYSSLLVYFHYAIAFVTLAGWCILAFGRRKDSDNVLKHDT